jgi:hypothetical protein
LCPRLRLRPRAVDLVDSGFSAVGVSGMSGADDSWRRQTSRGSGKQGFKRTINEIGAKVFTQERRHFIEAARAQV